MGTAVRGHKAFERQLFEVFDSLGFPYLVGEADQQVFGLVGGLGPGSVRSCESRQPILYSMIEQKAVAGLFVQ